MSFWVSLTLLAGRLIHFRIDGFFPGGLVDILFSRILTRQPMQAIMSRISSEIGEGY